MKRQMEEASGMSARTLKVFLKLQYTDHTWILIKTAKSNRNVNTYCLKLEKYSFLV